VFQGLSFKTLGKSGSVKSNFNNVLIFNDLFNNIFNEEALGDESYHTDAKLNSF